jgi:hypothetical protein
MAKAKRKSSRKSSSKTIAKKGEAKPTLYKSVKIKNP